jgi:hypothetical protein
MSGDAGRGCPLRDSGVSLRKARRGDLAYLRRWRNRHRNRFFDAERISADAQRRWFEEHRKRDNDFLFVVCHRRTPVGCIGIRLTDCGWDLYNVIRGRSPKSSAGCMSAALATVIEYACGMEDALVSAKVLPDNPAAAWYARNGFVVAARRRTFVLMRHRSGRSSLP